MLPSRRRVRTAEDFSRVVRGGVRAGRPTMVVHLGPAPAEEDPATPAPVTARAGFVVSRAVGPAVVRNRVRRRLRHLVAARLPALGPGTDVVVRALAPAAQASSSELAADLDGALRAARRRADRAAPGGQGSPGREGSPGRAGGPGR